ncbi:HNH endonuclease [Terrabacter sp. 28]|nr:HNH endonuclease [Terrabacter sp. 28]
MAPEPSTLELLRSRLADLEERQRAAGGVAEAGFWQLFPGRMPSASSGSRAPSARGRVKTRREAPAARPAAQPRGAWAGLTAEELDSIDLRDVRWTDPPDFEQMVNDPAWTESIEERIEAKVDLSGEGQTASWHATEAVTLEASLGVGLDAHGEEALVEATERVAAQRRGLEVTLVTLVSELVARGVDAPGGLSRVDWLRSLDASLTAGQAKAFVTVGTALADRRWARLRMLVATQQVTVGNAAQVLDFEERVAPVADPDDLATAIGDLTTQAGVLRPEELARLARHHTEQVRPPRDEDTLDHGRRQARGLWFTPPTKTGMVGLRGMLDPEGAAILQAAIDPLAAPRPVKDEHGHTTAPDERTPARRRMDALLTIVGRGVAAARGVPVTDKAKVVVLIDYDTLVRDLTTHLDEATDGPGCGAGGRAGRGTGTTLTGDVLSPSVVRRMACEAGIIPVVLGRDGAPLDVGYRERLFTYSQRLALIARDRGCSFTGCTVPATWCEAHHVVPWHRGGRTDLTNGALLCPHHHTHVHQHDLTATVTATGVTWHTR